MTGDSLQRYTYDKWLSCKKELRDKLTADDREGISAAYRHAQQRTLWERITKTITKM